MAEAGTATVESSREFGHEPAGLQKRWSAEIKLARKEFERYQKRCKKIVRRYRAESESDFSEEAETHGLQLLWSTVQTQVPAIYQFPPSAEVSRRFKTKDPVSRTAALVLERYLQVDSDRDGIGDELLLVLLDRLLCDRGQMWVEYEPVIGKVPQEVSLVPQPDGSFQTAGGQPYTGEPPAPGAMMGQQPFEQIVDVRARAIHLDNGDFLHSPARKWREVRWVARRFFYTRDECVQKFGKGMEKFGWKSEDIPLSHKAVMDDDEERDTGDLFKRAEVWEVWDDEKVYCVILGMGVPLEVKDRPLKLATSRWPCPRPYYGTMTNGTLIPVPSFVQWQDLAEEVDELTHRIESLTRAVKMVGVRASEADDIDKMLLDGYDNELIPVQNWKSFADKGGISGMIVWMPMEQAMAVLGQLNAERQNRIDYIYQINGIGDILRGQGDPRATATQEKIKASYGSLRLRQMQQDFGSFVERVLEIKAEIICETAPPEVMVNVSAIAEIETERQNIGPALEMLKSSRMRDLRIDVDEESMVALRDAEVQESRMQFLERMAPMVNATIEASQKMPALLDVTGEMLTFGARGFRAGRELEGTLDQFVEAVRQQAAQAREQAKNQPPQPPLPLMVEQVKAQNATNLEQQRHQAKMAEIDRSAEVENQKERAQAISEAAIEQFRAESKQQTAEAEAALDGRLKAMEHSFDMRLEKYKADLKADADRQAQIMRDAGLMRGLTAKRRKKVKYTPEGDIDSIEDEMDEGDGAPGGLQ